MAYSQSELISALIYAIPNGEQVVESMSIPRAVDEAAIELFRTQDNESEESEVVREALDDLRNIGALRFTPEAISSAAGA